MLFCATRHDWWAYLLTLGIGYVTCFLHVRHAVPQARLLNVLTFLGLVTILLTAVIIDENVWIPKEVVYAKGESVEKSVPKSELVGESVREIVLDGYILANDGNWVSMLRSKKRDVIRLKTEDLHVRKVCKYGPKSEFVWAPLQKQFQDQLPGYGSEPRSCRDVNQTLTAESPPTRPVRNP